MQVINHIHVLAKHVAHMPSYTGPLMDLEDKAKTRNLFSSSLVVDNVIDFESKRVTGDILNRL